MRILHCVNDNCDNFLLNRASCLWTGGTVALWVTYYQLKSGIDPQVDHAIPLIQLMVDAETAFLVYSIIATVLAVSIREQFALYNNHQERIQTF